MLNLDHDCEWLHQRDGIGVDGRVTRKRIIVQWAQPPGLDGRKMTMMVARGEAS
jgi:hypothetical protein